MDRWLNIHPEVEAALRDGQPVVALESTIISHGMPFPQNVETAKRVESIIRKHGAIPATIAILDGQIHVGLNEELLHRLATEPNVQKASRRDISIYLASGQTAATTVAATMIGAGLANIPIFATGGIGGVHRGAAETMDISADLQELAQTSVAVVSAGVKSILDIPLTLEYLETHGVPVVTLGASEFPAFYSRESGSDSPYTLSTPEEIAKMLAAKWSLGLKGGALIANPIPEQYSLPQSKMDAIIQKAIEEADEKAISGKELTPYLLHRIKEMTKGESLASNIELVCHNAAIAAQIAVHLVSLQA
ncbi:pseudouridine-5'-phosphate glycosidase [Pontibacter sp. G13]|uniref:pseudouridine-5'-phosphate glycosidase n=1 Tax=Pontibacter sp. G13 TaxID=3074898 RepID=UPI003906D041